MKEYGMKEIRTVKELRKELLKLPPDMKVIIQYDGFMRATIDDVRKDNDESFGEIVCIIEIVT